MKRIFTVLALLAVMTSAVNAQVKSVSAAQNAVENAKKDVENPKKNTKFATWIKYGKALVDAYDAPAGNGWINASRQELQLVSGNEKPVSVEKVTLGGQEWDKEVYPTRNYYFNAAGQLGLIEITKPVYENALDMALEAYGKANELDVKHAKTKDITGAILSIAGKYIDEAYTAYTLGDLAKASDYFEKAARANAAEPVCQVDSNSIYNAGFTAWLAGNNDRAKEFFEKSVEIGYYGEDGETYAKLADIAEKAGDAEKSKDYLEEGFQKFPQSRSNQPALVFDGNPAADQEYLKFFHAAPLLCSTDIFYSNSSPFIQPSYRLIPSFAGLYFRKALLYNCRQPNKCAFCANHNNPNG